MRPRKKQIEATTLMDKELEEAVDLGISAQGAPEKKIAELHLLDLGVKKAGQHCEESSRGPGGQLETGVKKVGQHYGESSGFLAQASSLGVKKVGQHCEERSGDLNKLKTALEESSKESGSAMNLVASDRQLDSSLCGKGEEFSSVEVEEAVTDIKSSSMHADIKAVAI
ncbi:hypothetical protein SELMODRAFT_421704 [Selaginella moellendorffii]|uniref:Uncharacterized protein n=1 Tax=Selaginella moellendorffii TaxID=88036 RepID=D8SG41_SELML|nr:hypothetical protein SELMODRAFT_421704 [Selaginella moellendorffii]